MQTFWYRWVNAGLTENQNYSERNRVKLLNKIAFIFLILMTVRIFLDVLDQDWIGTGIAGLIFILFALTFVFQYKGMTNFAAAYLLSVFMVMASALIVLLGRNLGAEFCFFTAIGMALMFYSESKYLLYILGGLCFSYIAGQTVHYFYPPPLENLLTPISYHFVFFANIASILVMTHSFAKESKTFQTKSAELLEDLKSKNDTLIQKQSHIGIQNKRLESVNKELERFAFIASHDLKTPLRNINSFLGLIKNRLTDQHQQDENLMEYLTYAQSSAKKMHFLIQNILEYSRLNKKEIELSEVDLNVIVKAAIQNLKTFIAENNAKIIVGDLPKVKGLDVQLTLLFQNLIENGIKYNKSKIPTVELSCVTFVTEYLITVKDNGIGINESYKNKVFEMFTRLHGESTYQGTGIGLAICKKIAENHSGKISLESIEKIGSTFKLRLPILRKSKRTYKRIQKVKKVS